MQSIFETKVNLLSALKNFDYQPHLNDVNSWPLECVLSACIREATGEDHFTIQLHDYAESALKELLKGSLSEDNDLVGPIAVDAVLHGLREGFLTFCQDKGTTNYSILYH